MSTHLDVDDLALVATGEASEVQREHVDACAQCRTEVGSFEQVTELLALGGPVSAHPPAHVWEAIQAEVDGTPAPAGSAWESRRRHREVGRQAGRSLGWKLLGAAAVGAGAMWMAVSLGSADEPTGPVVATADLDALESSVEPASAEVVERDGRRLLRVDTSSLPEVQDGYLQVWLLNGDASGMVTVGALSRSGEEFELPEGLSTNTFGTVDVSVEHYDGNPAHSGESLWRGAITST
ncbi:MAG TPA: anti-sigma factor [Ornithinimicrobium sp.]|uniref:anti-sigma factor n=1 Tax=Ornithinimicrobium sp. TaxID=1977084 RepID=UPI002B4A626F|nr:anti-sigma factor [Ornithinimicrobium sp.]HKJ12038.1 anti-sigma factor [Ornithinimicrobium sp.]